MSAILQALRCAGEQDTRAGRPYEIKQKPASLYEISADWYTVVQRTGWFPDSELSRLPLHVKVSRRGLDGMVT